MAVPGVPELPTPSSRTAAEGPGGRGLLGRRPATRLLLEGESGPDPVARRIRLLSFNIQAGIRTERYREYLTRGWRQFLHDPDRPGNLDRIGTLLRDYDIVALQEVDAGSVRSGWTNQVAWLAERAGLSFWYAQRNRRLGRFAQHGNGLIARSEPMELEDHPLPSAIPGRGAILASFPCADGLPLLVVSAHLSLGLRTRTRQLEWIAERIRGRSRVVLMGDLNMSGSQLLEQSPLANSGLLPALESASLTYPSWRPRLDLDHVLLTPDLEVEGARALDCDFSDHLPVAVDIRLPTGT